MEDKLREISSHSISWWWLIIMWIIRVAFLWLIYIYDHNWLKNCIKLLKWSHVYISCTNGWVLHMIVDYKSIWNWSLVSILVYQTPSHGCRANITMVEKWIEENMKSKGNKNQWKYVDLFMVFNRWSWRCNETRDYINNKQNGCLVAKNLLKFFSKLEDLKRDRNIYE